MMRRRTLLGAGGAFALATRRADAQTASATASATTSGATHALLVGINAYRSDPLEGCRNDVAVLEQALRPMAASITVLRDAEATRASFGQAWDRVAGRCQAGDRLIFSYAGHGNSTPKRIPQPGGPDMDDFIVFQPYDVFRAPHEIMMNSEIEQMFATLGRRNVSIVFIADCCHSGLLTRGIDRAAAAQHRIRSNAGAYPYDLVAQSLASRPPPPPSPRPVELEHVHFFAACQPWEEVPEITWQGRKHGALSLAVADGLEGAASVASDGRVTARALADYVVRTVRGTADMRQTPEVRIGQRAPALLRELTQPPSPLPAPSLLPVRLLVEGPVPPTMPALRQVRQVAAGEAFDLLWRPATGQTISALGDVVAQDGVTAELLPASVARVRALARLQQLVAAHALELRVERADQEPAASAPLENGTAVYLRSMRLSLVAEAVQESNQVLFNITGTGMVQLLFPDPLNLADAPVTPAGGSKRIPPFFVQEPYGTDRPVAVASSQPLGSLVAALREQHRRHDPEAAVAALEQAVAGSRWQLGLTGMVTKER